MSQIIIGYTTEGKTDVRFLASIIERTFVDIAFECSRQIEVITPIIHIKKEKADDFCKQILKCCQQAHSTGIMAFCVHVDSDAPDDKNVIDTKINPVISTLAENTGNTCNNIVPIIPIQMTEAWMLADKQLLKEEIGTQLNDTQLGISRAPESVAEPKDVIVNAIRIAGESLTKRRRKDLTIAELYQPIGQKIPLEALSHLSSYVKFRGAVREACGRPFCHR